MTHEDKADNRIWPKGKARERSAANLSSSLSCTKRPRASEWSDSHDFKRPARNRLLHGRARHVHISARAGGHGDHRRGKGRRLCATARLC